MKRFLPQSMTGLVALGFLLASAPLISAIILAEVALTRVVGHGEMLIREGVILARLSSRIRDEIANLERSAKQYVAIGDEELLQVVRDRAARVDTSLREMQAHGLTRMFADNLMLIREGLDEASEHWQPPPQDRQALEGTVRQIQSLLETAQQMILAANQAIDQESADLSLAAAQAQRVVTISMVALIPLTCLLAFAFTLLVSRPLRRAQAGINALGRGRYDSPIIINYPREMMSLGERLDWLRRRLAELEENQDRFLRNVSHELKTPLASMIEGVDLLDEGRIGALSREQQEIAGILKESASELEQLIDNLLAYAQWQSKHGPAQLDWFNVHSLVEDVLRMRKLPITTREIEIRLNLAADRLFGDQERLREALDNLVGNAIKHTRPGSFIEIGTRQARDEFLLYVRDFGKGVPDKDKLHIFDPFVRGSEQEEAGTRGTGIGLTIVRETAHAHEGTVEVKNANPGAKFEIRWPAAMAAR